MVDDAPITIPDPVNPDKVWRPENYEPGFEGRMTMRKALYKSQNLPAIETGLKYGLPAVVSYARRFGLRHNVPAVPSVSIGSCEATLMELVSAYTSFPNGGVRSTPYFIERIKDKNGRPVYQNIPQTQEVLRREAAWILVTMLRDVNIKGTAAAIWASGFQVPSGGKTGTTNDYSDAWYIGFTRHYTAGIWVGADDHVSMGPGNTGAMDAVPMWIDLMRYAVRGTEPEDFPRPDGVVEARVCPVSGLLAKSFCDQANDDYYIEGRQPTEYCKPEYHSKKASTVDVSTANRHRDQPAMQGKSESKKPDPRVRKTF
jgi:penicillin-binding protein 1A